MNVELLRQVQEKIQEHPSKFNMQIYFRTDEDTLLQEGEFLNACGTEACIAGWAVVLSGVRRDDVLSQSDDLPFAVFPLAARLLRLNEEEAEGLFFVDSWPPPFAARYRDAYSDCAWDQLAPVACERIEHFIATEGRE